MNRLLLLCIALAALAAGCGFEATSSTARSPAAPATRPSQKLTIIDKYWSADEKTYFVVAGGVERWNYCEVYLTLNDRRTGDWGNKYWDGTRSKVTVEVGSVEHAADGFEIECQ